MTRTPHYRCKIARFTLDRAAEFARSGVISNCLTPSKLTEASDGRHILCIDPANSDLPFVNIVDMSWAHTAEIWTAYRIVLPFITDLSIPDRLGGLLMSIDHESPEVGPAFESMVLAHYSDVTVTAWRGHVLNAIKLMQNSHAHLGARAA
jgi:hypothetical protein